MKKALFFLFLLTATSGLALSYTDIPIRVKRKVDTYVKSFGPQPDFVPTPAAQFTSVILPTGTEEKESTVSSLPARPESYAMKNFTHVAQTWNNCGPATVTMLMNHYGANVKQAEVAPHMKPDSEDKNVSPEDMLEYIQEYQQYKAEHLFNGTSEILKQLIAQDIPVIVEIWFEPHPNDGMGHYVLLKGYDDNAQSFNAHDSYRGPNITLPYASFDEGWKVFNRTYVVVYPKEKEDAVTRILGSARNRPALLQASLKQAQKEVDANQKDPFAYYNLGTTLSLMNNHTEAVKAFDNARTLKLPWRMFWYQFAIFESYLAEGRSQDVIDLANANLKQANNLEESYYYRGLAYEKMGNRDKAKADFQSALRYNKNFTKANTELDKLK